MDKTVKQYTTKEKKVSIQMDTTQKRWFCKQFRDDFLKCVNGLKAKNNLPPSWNIMDESILNLDKWMDSLENDGWDLDPLKDAIYVKLKKACDKLGFPFEDIWPFEIDSREPTALEIRLHMDAQRRRKKMYEQQKNNSNDSTFGNLFTV